MAIRFIINTPEDLVSELENRAQKSREGIGKTRTKLESNELKGEVYAFNEAIFYVKEYIKTLKENEEDARSAAKVGSLDGTTSDNPDSSFDISDIQPSGKVKA